MPLQKSGVWLIVKLEIYSANEFASMLSILRFKSPNLNRISVSGEFNRQENRLPAKSPFSEKYMLYGTSIDLCTADFSDTFASVSSLALYLSSSLSLWSESFCSVSGPTSVQENSQRSVLSERWPQFWQIRCSWKSLFLDSRTTYKLCMIHTLKNLKALSNWAKQIHHLIFFAEHSVANLLYLDSVALPVCWKHQCLHM